ncbi:hypothetical protein SELMODRAFT_227613 [Selaginella moellendorffii]|uniref:SAM-dependent MTase RsmB/NOP-type domain-containing protein n=1 Tax=Selaginella moellendorffii TaxID=88036 RepID=D8R5H2_SELML|nr:uncharacterized protein LOC9652692 [Selaginella moellendorffii]XP_024527020.1 uncharacterized protein LOC9652692 [Selaginella moellendorffii]EFJ32485.1 hypothetical protein SELMODRAFT_227613 [Selaginella moellendorffii]|eukprot:XP_002966458.1 uncharacterized protein LOC9652692 [Selaginella moellendorffii]
MACIEVAPAAARDPFSCKHDGAAAVSTNLLPLPPEFVDFLLGQNVDPRVYLAAQTLPRYFRVKPSATNAAGELAKELGIKVEPVSWLPGFFQCSSQASLASSSAYKSGKIYGMDAASGAAVAALDIQSGDHVLDVCAAPGAKLCMMAEVLGVGAGTLTGVDISRHRLAACRTMLQKYELGSRARLFLADGTTFSILPVKEAPQSNASVLERQSHQSCSYLLKDGLLADWRPPKSKRGKRDDQRAVSKGQANGPELFYYGCESGIVGREMRSVLAQGTADAALVDGYDKVLVDAECTHDGSLKHICKFEQWGWETFEKRFFNSERISTITNLQLRLLSNGFRLLKQGGTLVYSTCSFTYDQNEGVLKQFLAAHPDAEVREIKSAKSWPCTMTGLCLRFDPLVSNTNGQFVAKITKERMSYEQIL